MNAASQPRGRHSPFPANSKGRRLSPDRLLAFSENRIDREPLADLAGKSIVNPRQFDRRTRRRDCPAGGEARDPQRRDG